jgi:hypothetical protein
MVLRLFIFVAMLSCTPKKTDSSTKVVNGRPLTDAEFPSVVRVSIELGKDVNATCTASIISDSVLITASHCLVLENGLPASSASAVLSVGKKIDGGVIHLHPQYDDKSVANDIAFVKFPESTFKAYKPMTLSKKIPQKDDSIKIIGFGKNDHFDGASGGTKRIGFSTVDSVNESVNFRGLARPSDQSGKDAINSQGDSGGPMVDAQDEIIGISSTVDAIDAGDGKRTGHYTSIHDKNVAPFVNRFSDGTLPQNNNPTPHTQQPEGSENIGVGGDHPGNSGNPGTPGTISPIDVNSGSCLCSVQANRHGSGCTVTRAGKILLEAKGNFGCESAEACKAAWQGELSGLCTSFVVGSDQ